MRIFVAFLTGLCAFPALAGDDLGVLGNHLQANCFVCHGPDLQTAGINFDALLAERPLVRNRETWSRVIGALDVGKMPPPEAAQPSATTRAEMVAVLRRRIDDFDYSTIEPNPGFELMRRLTHDQYDNTLRDLFGTELDVTDRFPTELTGSTGFENSSNTLFLQSSLMERYIAAAQRVVDLALPDDTTNATTELVYFASAGDAAAEPAAARTVLGRFMERAYRRPPLEDELQRAFDQYDAARRSGLDYQPAIKQVIQSVLISPKFLLRVERGRPGTSPFRISDWELASRLSYFLWSSMPDQELFDLAANGRLSDPAVLGAQVDRMLADSRANTLGDIFAGQWLGFHHVGTRVRLDPIDNPWCTDTLMTAMRDETSMFFMSLLRENRPIDALIDADYTFVNEELAATLYGMQGVRGDEMRRVNLVDSNRGGIIGHPSVLALTSNYLDTSPVKRGTYVLGTILGTPPPEPPPNAGILSEEVAEMENMSFREKIEMHSKHEYCRGCHSRIDPIGFSLENFDAFGKWREQYEFRERVETAEEADESFQYQTETSPGPIWIHLKHIKKPIQAAGNLPDGAAFEGPAGLKHAILTTRHEDLIRQVTTKMLAFALGRQLEYYDEPAVRRIVAALQADGFRFQTLLHEIVASYPFQYKKNPTDMTLADAN